MGETRVDLLHLLEDLRDAYPWALEETILTEIVANSLDSGARLVSIRTDAAAAVVVVVDDGRGMGRRELKRFHDVAASSKSRGEGIGFAGVGIKLGLLACEEVLTESRRAEIHVATRWRLASRHRAPWRWVEPPGLLTGQGTGVCLRLKNPLSPLLDGRFLEATLRRHFEPLLDPGFDATLAEHYPGGVELRVDGRPLERRRSDGTPLAIVLSRKRRPCGSGILMRSDEPLPEDLRGVAISTRGKLIRRGWDWLGLTPATPHHIGGLVEVPALAEALTLNKADFLRSGPRGLFYLAVRKAIQQAVGAQLEAWGEGRDAREDARRRAARPLEKDLEAVLVGLADAFPALAPLVERRPGGQRLLPTADGPGRGALALGGAATEAREARIGETGATGPDTDGAPQADPATAPPPGLDPNALGERAPGPARAARYRLSIEFEERPQSAEISRLSQATVFVNTAHPAHRRAVASRAEGYHAALGVALALAREVTEPARTAEFVNAFLARWGEALSRDRRRRGAREDP